MAAPLLALAVLGKTMEAYGEYQQGKATSAYLRERGQVSLLQAEETLDRARLNQQQIIREGRKFAGEQIAQYAGSGVDVSSNATLSALEDTSSVIADQLYKNQREAEFEAFMKRKEAYSYERSARDTMKAAKIKSTATLLQAGGMVGGNVKRSPSVEDTGGGSGSSGYSYEEDSRR